MKRILIVEDDALLNKTLAYNLTLDGWDVTPALNARTAENLLAERSYDLVLLDINLPDGNGYDLCRLVKPEQERRDFLQGIRSQTDKLEFLVQSMGKASRLETGAVTLEKKDVPLLDTLAQAMSGIVYGAEQKGISVEVQCPDDLRVSHDSKWTAEALFNLLDNAVKYTPAGGKISVSVEQWEMYVKLDVADTGRGIPESRQAAIFRRFYREEEVHDQPGVGIGLYLAREIVTRQGGYIKMNSEVGRGSTFSVFLPRQ